MNIEVLILFINATLVTVLSSVVVIAILRKQYLPAIRKAEQEEQNKERYNSNDDQENLN
ncbi:hypothetical protein [Lentibacillus jeotgali]|uniref:hypothetical protein n=1 Tax=Lentibacillus jeotgali TaxID=558169 RepID=UPI0002D8B826|nr:hypothetical protein [Lentibacillus jeotgali]